MKNQGWIGVDLDGTLAYYETGDGVETIGRPIVPMQTRVICWLAEGKDVRIVTARVGSHPDLDPGFVQSQDRMIKAWCLEHLGKELPVTCSKDFCMVELWDDRCVQVIPNTGIRRCFGSLT